MNRSTLADRLGLEEDVDEYEDTPARSDYPYGHTDD